MIHEHFAKSIHFTRRQNVKCFVYKPIRMFSLECVIILTSRSERGYMFCSLVYVCHMNHSELYLELIILFSQAAAPQREFFKHETCKRIHIFRHRF